MWAGEVPYDVVTASWSDSHENVCGEGKTPLRKEGAGPFLEALCNDTSLDNSLTHIFFVCYKNHITMNCMHEFLQ